MFVQIEIPRVTRNTMLIHFSPPSWSVPTWKFFQIPTTGGEKLLSVEMIKSGTAAACPGDASDGEAELEKRSGLRDRFADNPRQVALLPPPTATRGHLGWRADMRLRSRSSHAWPTAKRDLMNARHFLRLKKKKKNPLTPPPAPPPPRHPRFSSPHSLWPG